MKTSFKFLGIAATFLMTFNVYADSALLDKEPLNHCGGYGSEIELRRADNGDLSLKLDGNRYCHTLRFYDRSSGLTIKKYDVKGTSYTLSQEQREALGDDCQVGIDLSSGTGMDRFYVTLGWWCESRNQHVVKKSANSYQLSNKGNCKLMIHGEYSNQNVDSRFCQGANDKNDVVSYELSNKGNCKLMINGEYSNQNVEGRFCH